MPNEPADAFQPHEFSNRDTNAAEAVDLDYAGRSAAPVSNAPAGRLDWAAIGVRLVALWCFFATIPGIFLLSAIFTDRREMTASYRLLTLLPYCAYAIVGVILWLIASSLARRMVGDIPPVQSGAAEATSAATSRSDAQALAFSVVGVVFTALASAVAGCVPSALHPRGI